MRTALRVLVPICLLLALLSWTSSVQAGSLTSEQWREDLAALDTAVRTDHKFPFHTVSEEDYTASIESLHERISQLSDQEIIVAMVRIMASIHDGHTRLQGWYQDPDWGFERYPLALYWFDDGLYVRQAHPDYADLVGAKIVSIGGKSAEEARDLVLPITAADNIHSQRRGTSSYLVCPQILMALDLIEDADEPGFVLEKDGRTWTPEIVPLDEPAPGWIRSFADGPDWADARDEATAPTPLWLRNVEKTFWLEYLPDERILYVQQNQVRNGPTETLESFYERVWQTLQENDVEKLVLDVRLNGGGNNYLNKPAVTTMVRADAQVQTFVIIGTRTFSACQNLVNELSRWSDCVFVGEPTGERVNFYGDTRSTDLPHSGLTVRASFLWWQNLDPRDTSDALYPDVAADLTFADYANHRDPAMEAIRHFEGFLTADGAVSLFQEQGTEAALASLRAAVHDSMYRHRNMESVVNDVGYRLLGQNQLDEALAVFQLNVEEFPDSWNVYDSLGETYETRGDLDRALELFRQSLSINPDSPTGRDAVERLEKRLAGASMPH